MTLFWTIHGHHRDKMSKLLSDSGQMLFAKYFYCQWGDCKMFSFKNNKLVFGHHLLKVAIFMFLGPWHINCISACERFYFSVVPVGCITDVILWLNSTIFHFFEVGLQRAESILVCFCHGPLMWIVSSVSVSGWTEDQTQNSSIAAFCIMTRPQTHS